jgi:hypothetical protein
MMVSDDVAPDSLPRLQISHRFLPSCGFGSFRPRAPLALDAGSRCAAFARGPHHCARGGH